MSEFITNFVNFIQSYGVVGLAVISFAESSFFPIPPDVLLIPMAFMNRKLAIFYAMITTVSSVVGGIFGHIIGSKFGRPLLKRFFKEAMINKVENYFEKYGGWSIAIAGFTPIPYKIFTISAGAFNVRMFTLIMASILGRGARFFLEGFFIFFLGDTAKYYLQNYFEVLTVGITVLFILIYFIWKKLKSVGRIKNTGIVLYLKGIYNKIYNLTLKYRKYDEAATYFFISIFASITSLFMLLELIGDYLERGGWNIDGIAIKFVNSIRSPLLSNIFGIITISGNTIPMIIITLIASIVLIYMKKRREGIFLSLNTLGLWIFNMLLKNTFKRPRPSTIRLVEAQGYSFPSGHAMIFMGFVIMLVYFIVVNSKSKKVGILVSLLILFYSAIVGLSRIYLGVHYLSDVAAGWFAGILWSSSSIAIYRILAYRRNLGNGKI